MLQTVVHAVFVQFIYNHVSISQSILRCLVLRKTVTLRAHKTSELRRSTMGVVTTWDTVHGGNDPGYCDGNNHGYGGGKIQDSRLKI